MVKLARIFENLEKEERKTDRVEKKNKENIHRKRKSRPEKETKIPPENISLKRGQRAAQCNKSKQAKIYDLWNEDKLDA